MDQSYEKKTEIIYKKIVNTIKGIRNTLK